MNHELATLATLYSQVIVIMITAGIAFIIGALGALASSFLINR